MKIRVYYLLVAGLAIGFTLPTFAQQHKHARSKTTRGIYSRLIKNSTMDSSTAMPLPWPRSTQRTRLS